MKLLGTLFSGGELAGVGITAAGWQHAWGVEYDPAIAAVAKLNGFDVTVADVLACDPHLFAPVDALHASPVCTRASNANNSAELNDEGTKEAPLDIAMGEKVAEFIDVLAPRVVTIENVYAYRNFKAFGKITAALTRGGYFWDYDHLNAADFGVPQTRRRLILRAVKGALLPHLPGPVEWVGWYAAIEDLLPDLPTSQFANWQLERLPEEIRENALVSANGTSVEVRGAATPSVTVVASDKTMRPRAFIMSNAKTLRTDGLRSLVEPALTVTGQSIGRTRAFLVSNQHSQPHGQGAPQMVDDAEPAMPVTATIGARIRAWLSAGRVVAMTPRALARFQSVPDWYKLPDKASLACKIIGNGVPCLLMQRLYEGLQP